MKTQRKRLLGRQKERWMEKVEKNLAEIVIYDGETVAQDGYRWEQVCVAIMAFNGL